MSESTTSCGMLAVCISAAETAFAAVTLATFLLRRRLYHCLRRRRWIRCPSALFLLEGGG